MILIRCNSDANTALQAPTPAPQTIKAKMFLPCASCMLLTARGVSSSVICVTKRLIAPTISLHSSSLLLLSCSLEPAHQWTIHFLHCVYDLSLHMHSLSQSLHFAITWPV